MFKTWKDAVDNWNILCKDEKKEACDKFDIPMMACCMTRQNLLKSIKPLTRLLVFLRCVNENIYKPFIFSNF